MSADNWAICPKCKKDDDEKWKIHEERLATSYGKMPVDEYMKLRALKKEEPETTLREDYDIGLYDGSFYVDYSAKCSCCDFEFNFKKEINILV